MTILNSAILVCGLSIFLTFFLMMLGRNFKALMAHGLGIRLTTGADNDTD